MQKKVAGYFFLSLISFCLFFAIFHTVANAQTLMPPNLSQPTTIIPTPTLYIEKVEPTMTPPQPTKPPSPSPTVIIYTLKTLPPELITPEPPTATPAPQPTIAVVTDLEVLFAKYSDEYHIDREQLKRIARCESGFNTTSNFRGIYIGMFQFGASTWISNRTRMGLDTNPDLRTNAEESIRTAAYMIANGGIGAWPNCK